MKRNYYQILGIDKDSNPVEIKTAYKNLALTHHPDRNNNTESNLFKEISEAYSILSDTEKRYQYDLLGKDGVSDISLDINPEQIFQNLFGGKMSMIFMNISNNNTFKSEPLYYDLKCNLDDVYLGNQLKINYRKYIVYNAKLTPILLDKSIMIPKGCENNYEIIFPEEGNHSLEGDKGDLIVKVIIQRHPLFTVNDSDLSMEIKLLVSESLCGFKYVLPFLDGKKYLIKSDEIVNHNTVTKISNFGLPRNDKTRGDLYISYLIENPATISSNRKELLQKILPCRQSLSDIEQELPLLSTQRVNVNISDSDSDNDSDLGQSMVNPLEDILNNPLKSLFNMSNLF